jgi:tetratricopeptide (TPR) repeat protein
LFRCTLQKPLSFAVSPKLKFAEEKMKRIFFIFVYLLSLSSLCAQEINFKEQAISAFRKGDLNHAVELLEQAKNTHPNDAEIYYYLGYFSHYLAYDSRPLIGHDKNYSDRILIYLNKAVELDPNFGDAYYFIGAEYGARAIQYLQEGNEDKYISAYETAFEKKLSFGFQNIPIRILIGFLQAVHIDY